MTWCFCAHLSSKSISHRTDMIDGCLNLSQYLNYIEQLHALQIGFVIVADQMPTQLYPNVEWKHDPQIWQTMNLSNGDNDERETRQFGNVWRHWRGGYGAKYVLCAFIIQTKWIEVNASRSDRDSQCGEHS
eukprot:891876_1